MSFDVAPEQEQTAPAPQHLVGPWLIEIPQGLGRSPGLSANDRVNAFQRNRATQAIRDFVMLQLRSLMNGRRMPRDLDQVSVQVTWHVTDRRTRDEDNLAPLCKAIYDAIGSNRGTGARLVPDDDPAHMQKLQTLITRVPGVPAGFTVTIRNTGGIR